MLGMQGGSAGWPAVCVARDGQGQESHRQVLQDLRHQDCHRGVRPPRPTR
jgi:hypothetical protein